MSILYDGNGNQIEVSGETEVRPEPDVGDVPRIYITGALPATKNDGESPVMLTYKSKTLEFTSYATLKVQGDSSTRYAKKNFTIKLFKDAEHTSKDKRVFKSWSKRNKFVIKANWIDITHARNVVGARIWSDMVASRSDYNNLPPELTSSDNNGAIDGFPVMVFANGLYYGRYAWNIPKDGMLNMDEDNVAHAMIQGQSNTDNGCKFRSTSVTYWTDELTDDLTHVQARWQAVLSFVSTSTDTDFKANLSSYFSVPSLIDWYLFGLAFFAYDSYGKNQSYLTYDGNYFICSAYDMDCILNIFWTGTMPFQATESWFPYQHIVYIDTNTGEHSGVEAGNYLFERLASLYSIDIKARWAELRQHGGALSYENIDLRFDEWCSHVTTDQMAEDYAVTTADGAFATMGNIPGGNVSTNNIQQIRQFAHDRLAYIDTLMV